MVDHILRPGLRLSVRHIAICMRDYIMLKPISNSERLLIYLENVAELFVEKSAVFDPCEKMEVRNNKQGKD